MIEKIHRSQKQQKKVRIKKTHLDESKIMRFNGRDIIKIICHNLINKIVRVSLFSGPPSAPNDFS
jgi:hypothetical protein